MLDVGCGTGQATRDVARIAVNGSALGVDLSSQMLALAREHQRPPKVSTTSSSGTPTRRSTRSRAAGFDVVISRMGSMFFGDPIAAFTNLHRALRPEGRLTLLTWQGVTENEWLTEFRAAMAVGRDLPTPPPDAPSPFAFCDPDRVRAILGAAGFVDITFQSLHEPMSFGPDPDDAFDFVSELTGWMLEGLDEAGRDAALAALRATIAGHTDDPASPTDPPPGSSRRTNPDRHPERQCRPVTGTVAVLPRLGSRSVVPRRPVPLFRARPGRGIHARAPTVDLAGCRRDPVPCCHRIPDRVAHRGDRDLGAAAVGSRGASA